MNRKKISRDKIIKICAALAAFLLLAFHGAAAYTEKVQPSIQKPKAVLKLSHENEPLAEITKGTEVVQEFEFLDLKADAISMKIGTFARENDSSLNITFEEKESGKILGEWKVETKGLEDNKDIYLPLENQIEESGEKTYLIRVTSKDAKSGNGVALYRTGKELYQQGTLFVNGEEQAGDLVFSVLNGTNTFLKGFFAIVYIALFAMLGLLIVACFVRKWKLERVFVAAALSIGLLYMIIMPAYSAADEHSHINSSYYYSNKMLFQQAVNEEGEVMVRKGDLLMNSSQRYSNTYVYGLVWDHFFETTTDSTMVAAKNSSVSDALFVVFLPQAVGLTVARLLHLGCVPTLFLGRLFALLFFTGCGYFAIKKIPFGKMILFAVALLPINIELAASFSYDGIINGAAFVFIAYCLYLAYEKEKAGWKDMVLLAVCMFILAPAKIVYILLGLFCLIIPKAKLGAGKKYYMGIGIVAAGGLLPLIISRISVMTNYLSRSVNTVSYSGTPGFTLSGIMGMPMATIRFFYDTLRDNGEFYLRTQLGGLVSWLNLSIPWTIIIGFLIILLLSSIMEEREQVCLKARTRAGMLSIAGMIMLALMMVFLLTWTTVDSSVINGVQGRYFTPILPLILLCLRNKNLTFKKNINYGLVMGIGVLQFYALWNVFETIVAR